MDFLTIAPHDQPKQSYQCLAALSIGPGAGRRGSGGSDHGEDGGGITRILSGGRRRSVQTGNAGATTTHPENEGTWYWRCRVGVTADNLVIMPISEPPNPVLKQRPPPLSGVANNTSQGHNRKSSGGGMGQQSAGEKITGFGRRLSAAFINPGGGKQHEPHRGEGHMQTQSQAQMLQNQAQAAHQAPAQDLGNQAATSGPSHSSGDAALSNATATADTTNMPTETGWPGMIDGQPLHGIIVPLHSLKKEHMKVGGKAGECHVSVNIGSAIAGKGGNIRFEFDKDSIGGKAEAELLMHNIQQGVANASPLFGNVQLGKHAPLHQPVVPDKYSKVDWKDDVRGRW